jgi:DNA polymerase III epsilon subunit-like protein
MPQINFTTWFETKALNQLKSNIAHLNQLIDEQTQIFKREKFLPLTNEIPLEYLEFQVERCLESLKVNLLTELKNTSFSNKFITWDQLPVDKPISLENHKNTLMQKAKLSASAHIFQAMPQLAFIDIETDGIDIESANILQVAIIKPIIDPVHDSLNYFQTWSKYILPYEGYSQKDNKAYHINHIGDKELEQAMDIDDAIMHISYHICNAVLVGYNINSFDIPILRKHLIKHNEPILYKYSIDLYPTCWKDKKQKLQDAIKAYNIPSNPNPHDATADAACCIDLLNEIIERHELPNNEEDLLDLFISPQNIWQNYYKKLKVIDINPDHKNYSHLLFPTPASSLKRKHSENSEKHTIYKQSKS